MKFTDLLDQATTTNNSLLCVGLDPDLAKLPAGLDQFSFNKAIIDATHDLVCCFKPNSAFYEADGSRGIDMLKQTCDYIRAQYPTIPILLDYKRGDIGNTNNHYAKFAFGYLKVDAVTIQPYQGQEAVDTFLEYKDKGIVVLCRTSNPGSIEFQDLLVDGKKLYLKVAENVRDHWNKNNNCHVVVGATFPKELSEIRTIIGDEMIILVPGMGAQGGAAKTMVKAGLNSNARGIIINSSRETIFASNGKDFAQCARKKAILLRDEINKYRGV